MFTTPIATKGVSTCKCGEKFKHPMQGFVQSTRCPGCNGWLKPRFPRPTVVSAMEAAGIKLTLDYDDQLICETEQELDEDLRQWLFLHQSEIIRELKCKSAHERSVFVGGSMNGKRHGHGARLHDPNIYVHVKHAHWETYRFRDRNDPRLFYVGMSRSKAKAKRGVYEQTN